MGNLRLRGTLVGVLVAGVAAVGLPVHSASAAQSRTYVVNWFEGASYTRDENCPTGINIPVFINYNALNFAIRF